MASYKEDRPWGKFYVLEEKSGYKIKRIVVNPQGRLSLQSHRQRSEHWVVTKGIARVSVDNEMSLYSHGEHIYIPRGTKHRLENLTEDIVEVIEIQCGDYLGEDDIVRYEDVYSRA